MNSAERYQARREAEENAGREINHVGSRESQHMSDRHVCSCGWESAPYHDGAEYAQQDWVKHIQERGAEIHYPEPA